MPEPTITERLANMNWWTVLIVIAVLLVIRWLMLRQKTNFTKQIGEIAESLAVALGLVFLIIRPFIIQAFFIPSESMVPTLYKDDHIMVNKFIYRFTQPKRGDVIVFRAPKAADNLTQLESQKQERDFIKRVVAVPGDEVRITPGYVMVGDVQYKHQGADGLRELLSDQPLMSATVKLVSKKAALVDGHLVTRAEIAVAAGAPNDSVRIIPGRVYVNGKAIKEPYLNEDPDSRYPDENTPRQWITEDSEGREVVKIPKGRLLVMGDNRNNSYDARFWGLLERPRVLGKAMFIFWPLGRIRWIH